MIEHSSLWLNQTSVVIIIQLIVFYYKLGLRMIVHPGTFFAAIWLFSVFSQQILMNFDLALVRDLDLIRELTILVLFTSLFFMFWVLIVSGKRDTSHRVNFDLNILAFQRLTAITLGGAVALMLYQWYSLGLSSFNLAHIRDINTSDKTNYFGNESNIVISLLKYTQFFYPLIGPISGYYLASIYLLKKSILIEKRYLYFGLIIAVVYVFTNGGRNPLFEGVKYYFVGVCFALPAYFSSSERKWLLRRILFVVIGLSIFSTAVSDSRSEYHATDVYSKNFDNPVLSALSGGIEYAGAHYYGYQIRNTDTYDENNLGFGYYTFYSLFDITIPLSNYFGVKGNLGNFLGYKENKIDYFYLWENNYEGYFTTNSVYLGLKLDFGFYGSILFLFVFTFYTNYLFEKIKRGRRVTIYTLFWFSLCFEFWAASNFQSSYSAGLISGVIMTVLFSWYFVNKGLIKKT
jgi:oligosaccharide repeat unit polymerase